MTAHSEGIPPAGTGIVLISRALDDGPENSLKDAFMLNRLGRAAAILGAAMFCVVCGVGHAGGPARAATDDGIIYSEDVKHPFTRPTVTSKENELVSSRFGSPLVFDQSSLESVIAGVVPAIAHVDDFPLASATDIRSVRFWVGSFAVPYNGFAEVFFYADAGGSPGALIAQRSTTLVSATPVPPVDGGFSFVEAIHDLDAPVSLPAGTYWIRIQVQTPACSEAAGSLVLGLSSTNFGAPRHVSGRDLCTGPFQPAGQSVAFSLYGDPACTPIVLVLTNDAACGFNTRTYLEAHDPYAIYSNFLYQGTPPSLSFLLNYDAVFVYTRGAITNNAALGNLLADYHDAGGGVVIAGLANSSGFPFSQITGRWTSGGYDSLQSTSSAQVSARTLGTVFVPDHPIMDGVNSVAANAWFTVATASPGSNTIAAYDDGNLMVATKMVGLHETVSLTFMPTRPACAGGNGISEAADGARLAANAIRYAAGCYQEVDPCSPDTTDPVASCVSTLEVCLDEFGAATIEPTDIDNGSNDACGGVTLSLDIDTFSCADVGAPVTVTLTVEDASGNTSICTAEVTVNDCDDPEITDCPSSFTTKCNTPEGYNLSYVPTVDDNCTTDFTISPENPLPYGTTTVTVTVFDVSGNTDECQFDVTVTPDEQEPYRTPSIAAEDGYVREPDTVLLAEGPAIVKGQIAQIGDDGGNFQNRGVFSFDTSGLPDDAVVTRVALRLTRSNSAGNVLSLGNLLLDMGDSIIGDTTGLDTFDYADDAAAALDVATSFPLPGGNGFTTFAEVDPAYFGLVDVAGRTQFRVRFETTTDNDGFSDYISLYTGEANSILRPELIVEYYFNSCFEFPVLPAPCNGPFELEVYSSAAEDGAVGESHYTSEVGGSSNSISGTSTVGDTGARTQQKLYLHFDTSAIPADATVTGAVLRLYRNSAVGTPAASLGDLVADMRNPYLSGSSFRFGDTVNTETTDFQAYAHFEAVATIPVPTSNTFTSASLNPTGLLAINKGGATQMRVRFTLPDDGDFLADQVTFGTGNFGATSPGRPRLTITYFTPCP